MRCSSGLHVRILAPALMPVWLDFISEDVCQSLAHVDSAFSGVLWEMVTHISKIYSPVRARRRRVTKV